MLYLIYHRINQILLIRRIKKAVSNLPETAFLFLYVESKMHDIAILHYIFFTFYAEAAIIPAGGF